MKCVICGRESSKPVCEVCAKSIAMDFPFILNRGLVVSDEFSELNEETGILFHRDLERLNTLAKKALGGEELASESYLMLSKFALHFHRKFSFILDNLELGENYFLNLAREFASRSDNNEAKYLLAQAYFEAGATEELEAILDGIWRERRDYALLYGKGLVANGKWGRAMEIYNEYLKENEDDVEFWSSMADAIYASGNYEDAERAYLRVLQRDKDNARAWYMRGLCLKNMGKWGGAMQSLQTAIRKSPRYKDAYEELLTILMERGMYNRALETLKKMKEAGFDVASKIAEVEAKVVE